MKMKKVLASLLAVALAVPQITSGAMPQTAPVQVVVAEDAAVKTIGNSYFYDQISTEAQVFYHAIQKMHDQGIMKTGNGDYDMTVNGDITQAQAEAYAEGGAGVLELFGQARDAFYMDHTDIFYVDISSLSIRVTYDGSNYHVYIGTGRRDSYYATGYTSASQVNTLLANYDAAVAKIADEARNVTVAEGENQIAKQVEYVHDYLTQHTSYRLENACKPENLGFIRTAYGALVAGEAVCEGYARAFKAVMDALGIPCVLVNGVYRHGEDQLELHMWTEVEIDGQWYGVDPTMDDPKSPTVSYAGSGTGIDGYESHEYLLVGSSMMDVHHAVSGFISDARFEFRYPALELYGYGVNTAYNNGDLMIGYDPNGELDGETAEMFHVSYKGWGQKKAEEMGYYMLCNLEGTGWYYIAPEYYPALVDTETELLYPVTSQVDDVQFAVTNIPYSMTSLGEYEIIDQVFYGTESDLLAISGVYYNSHGGYEPPPYPKTVTPSMTSKLYTDNGGIFHVSITYNDKLITVDGEEQGVVFDTTGPTAALEKGNTKIENFAWDGESTVTFDFKPSKMFADNNAFYYITLSGLVGEKSGKAPFQVTYLAGGASSFCCMRANGFNWNVFGQPALIDNTDISTNDWKTADGEPVDEMLAHRMVLVASSTTPEQTEAMNGLIDGANTGKVLKSETYNISLTVCQKMVIQTGQGVRVSLGFPEGYGPEDEGVTFKAYHFMKDDAGNVTGVEEIPCILTKYGLIIECKSFSPFAVVAVEDDGTQTNTDKSIAVVSTTGGKISGADSIITLKSDGSATLSITPDEGYVIESISVDGAFVEISDNSAMTLAVGYEDFAGASGIVDVKFVAKSVIEKEASNGETAVQIDAEAEQPTVQYPQPPTEEPETTEATATETTTSTSETTTTTTETSTSTSASTTNTTTTTTTTTTSTAPPASSEPTVSTTVIPGEDGEATKVIVVKPDGVTDVYLLYAIDSLDYEKAGFTIYNEDRKANKEIKTVYESILIEGEEFTAESLGGMYLLALKITNVPDGISEKMTAKPELISGTAKLKIDIETQEEMV